MEETQMDTENVILDSTTCKRTSQKEGDILQAATELFSEGGFSGTTTSTIAKKANVSEKTLFKYFPTKQALYEKTLNPALSCLIGESRPEAPDESHSVRDILHDFFLDKLSLANRDPKVLKLTIHEFIANPAFRAILEEDWKKHHLRELLLQIELSESRQEKYTGILEHSLVRAVVGLLASYAFDKSYVRPGKNFDDEKEIEFMLDLLLNGIHGMKKEEGNEL